MRVLVGLPAYDRRVCTATMTSLLNEVTRRVQGQDSHTLEVAVVEGCSDVELARNTIAEGCIRGKYDALMFVDHDVSWEAGSMVKLIDSGYDVCAGVYPQKLDTVNFAVLMYEEEQRCKEWLRMASIPMGFMCIRTRVLKDVMQSYGRDYPFWSIPSPHPLNGVSEDAMFCREWREIGGNIWVDTSMRIAHHDGSRVHSADFLEWYTRAMASNRMELVA